MKDNTKFIEKFKKINKKLEEKIQNNNLSNNVIPFQKVFQTSDKFIDLSKGPFLNYKKDKTIKNSSESLLKMNKNSFNEKFLSNKKNEGEFFKKKFDGFLEKYDNFNNEFIENFFEILSDWDKSHKIIIKEKIFKNFLEILKKKFINFKDNFENKDKKFDYLKNQINTLQTEKNEFEAKIRKFKEENNKAKEILAATSTNYTEKNKNDQLYKEIEKLKCNLNEKQKTILSFKEKETKISKIISALKKKGINFEEILSNSNRIIDKDNEFNNDEENSNFSEIIDNFQKKRQKLFILGNSLIMADHSSNIL